MYTCSTSKRTEQCIGVLKIKSEEQLLASKSLNSINGQRFVACGTQVPINNYNKMNEDQLKSLTYNQTYHKGIPSKVCIQ